MDRKDRIKISNLTKISMARSILDDLHTGPAYGVGDHQLAPVRSHIRLLEKGLTEIVSAKAPGGGTGVVRQARDSTGIVLEPGTALVIRGAAGCGKSTLAHQIASERGGSFVTSSLNDLQRAFGLGELLRDNPNIVIIEEFEMSEKNVAVIEPLISCDEIACSRKGEAGRHVKAPQFILCVGSDQRIPDADTQLIFNIIDLL